MSDPIEEALKLYASGKSFTESIEPLTAKIAELKAEMERLKGNPLVWKRSGMLGASATAVVKGMQRAKEIADRHRSNTPYDERDRLGCLVNAIDAEIAKMGKPQPDETTELKAALDSVSFPDRRWK